MAGTLAGKVALVTGGARGIGKAICERLAAEGASLAIVDIMLDVAQATADEFTAKGINAKAYAANVAKFEDAESTIAKVVEDFGKLDILVNNAGITRDTLMMRMTEADFDAVIAVNLKGTFNFTKAACKVMMKARSGKIVNISSVVGRMGNAGQANYSASKAGVIGLTKTTAKEFIDRAVVLEIKMLLKSSDVSVQEIAYRLHFPDQSYLGRFFKKHTGESPTEYRSTTK